MVDIFGANSTWFLIILFPIVVLGLWQMLFNSKNSNFTKIFVEGGFALVGIPIIILTFLSIPMMALLFWANSTGLGKEVTTAILVVLGFTVAIVEYFWFKRQIKMIEEREQMTFWQYLKKTTSREHRAERAQQKKENKEEASSFFDEISDMNKKRRELDREEKEKLRRALLGELDSE